MKKLDKSKGGIVISDKEKMALIKNGTKPKTNKTNKSK